MSEFFKDYLTITIYRQHSESYILKTTSGSDLIELWWNGLEWDLSFTEFPINQAFLEEVLRLLKHLNNGGEV
jgi:hypothetical protein